jgi:hypothetical protein
MNADYRSVQYGSAFQRLVDFAPDASAQHEDSPLSDESLKIEINNFLWMHAPAGMPIGEADKLSLAIFEAICEARNRYAPEPLIAGGVHP